MAVSFEIAPHRILPGVQTVQVFVDGELAAIIYPAGEAGIKIVSAHSLGANTEGIFPEEVVVDDGTTSIPPIPHVLINFLLAHYMIRDGKLVRPS